MAKKKKDIIAEQLSALKPAVPTKTRYLQETASPEPVLRNESENRQKTLLLLFGFGPIFQKNFDGLEKMRTCIVKQGTKFHELVIQSWKNMAEISWEIFHANYLFLFSGLGTNRERRNNTKPD